MSMTQCVYRDTSQKICITFAISIPNIHPFAFNEGTSGSTEHIGHGPLVALPEILRHWDSYGVTWVPTPAVGTMSSSMECGCRRSPMRAWGTPDSTAAKHASMLGSIPDSSSPSTFRNSSTVIEVISDVGSGQSP